MLQTILFTTTISDVVYHLQIYHPNIDLEGNVCLNILREDWKPVLNINTVIYGLSHLFTVSPILFSAKCYLYVPLLLIQILSIYLCSNPIMRIP